MTKRIHIILPLDIVADIDKLVGKRGRSSFLADLARRAIKIQQQRKALRAAKGAWSGRIIPNSRMVRRLGS
jgi:metal-responsive CopG/Arc/MetJ family transcriptional regulator